MYLLQPSELAEGARGKHVQVHEYDNGAVRVFLGNLKLLERALDAAWPEAGQSAEPSEPTVVDSILAHALGALAARSA
jgi:hypothetical protein